MTDMNPNRKIAAKVLTDTANKSSGNMGELKEALNKVDQDRLNSENWKIKFNDIYSSGNKSE